MHTIATRLDDVPCAKRHVAAGRGSIWLRIYSEKKHEGITHSTCSGAPGWRHEGGAEAVETIAQVAVRLALLAAMGLAFNVQGLSSFDSFVKRLKENDPSTPQPTPMPTPTPQPGPVQSPPSRP